MCIYKAVSVDNTAKTTIIQKKSMSKLIKSIEKYTKLNCIILEEGERLFFPKGQEYIVSKNEGLNFIYRFLIMDGHNICHPRQVSSTWKIERVIK